MTVVPYLEDAAARGELMKAMFGRGYVFWAEVVALQRDRLTAALADLDDRNNATIQQAMVLDQEWLDAWNIRALADAHFLFVAVRHVLRHANWVQKLIGHLDRRVAKTVDAFHRAQPHTWEMRNVLEHWDETSRGEEDVRSWMGTIDADVISLQAEVLPSDDDLVMTFGDATFALIALADATLTVARTVDAIVMESLSDA